MSEVAKREEREGRNGHSGLWPVEPTVCANTTLLNPSVSDESGMNSNMRSISTDRICW